MCSVLSNSLVTRSSVHGILQLRIRDSLVSASSPVGSLLPAPPGKPHLEGEDINWGETQFNP